MTNDHSEFGLAPPKPVAFAPRHRAGGLVPEIAGGAGQITTACSERGGNQGALEGPQA
ncbi:hypothetical protein [Streptomyces fodineus]|uniref:hypothetical protein n=1 Tax=Streptomyces fodineus TaxID=1904616 RepID=UPI00131B977C|nr:hypothetical protein [Streptomyces fodineus]